jgi:predicted nuclease of predicted toxin-antitoxin system
MIFFADESIEAEITLLLRARGHIVFSIAELFPSISDIQVLNYAVNQNAALLTNDKDFGELVHRQNLPHYDIVLLRLRKMSPLSKAKVLTDVINKHGEELISAFTVISVNSVRIRHVE